MRIATFSKLLIAAALTIPLTLSSHADELKRRGMAGVRMAPVDDNIRTQVKLDAGTPGVLIQGVVPGSAAEAAGLQAEDVILSVDGVAVDSPGAVSAALRTKFAGDMLKFVLWRHEKKENADLTLRERPRETATDYQVTFDAVKTGNLLLRTFVTKPSADGKYPAVLLIPSLNNASGEFPPDPQAHPFKWLLQELTRAGYVTMRVDPPGVGDSQGGNPADVSLADMANAFRAGLEKLRTLPFVDASRIFVIGHGGGADLIPLAVDGIPVTGVVAFGCVARPPAKFFIDASVKSWQLEGFKPDEIDKRRAAIEPFFTQCFSQKKTPTAALEASPDSRAEVAPLIQGDAIAGRKYTYWQELSDLDLLAAWKKVKAPVLTAWGKADFRTFRDDHAAIADAINTASPGRAKFVEISGVDHMFQKMQDEEESYLAGFTGEFNEDLLKTLKSWLEEAAKKS